MLDVEDGPLTPVFLQYTSGSTGFPRGAVITHGNVMNQLQLVGAQICVEHFGLTRL